jgi:hypothetical protein
MQLVEGGDIEGVPEQLPPFLTELFSPSEIEEMSNKTLSVRQDVIDIPELLLKTDWDMMDFRVCSKYLGHVAKVLFFFGDDWVILKIHEVACMNNSRCCWYGCCPFIVTWSFHGLPYVLVGRKWWI